MFCVGDRASVVVAQLWRSAGSGDLVSGLVFLHNGVECDHQELIVFKRYEKRGINSSKFDLIVRVVNFLAEPKCRYSGAGGSAGHAEGWGNPESGTRRSGSPAQRETLLGTSMSPPAQSRRVNLCRLFQCIINDVCDKSRGL